MSVSELQTHVGHGLRAEYADANGDIPSIPMDETMTHSADELV
jgi:hypothetical protein